MPTLLEWLISLRITLKDAREYVTALMDLGFDDLQSLQEDVTEADLRQIGMKPGHIRRVSRALLVNAHPPRLRGLDAVGDSPGPPQEPSYHADNKARRYETSKGREAIGRQNVPGSIVIRAGGSCVLTCDDGRGCQHHLAIAPFSGKEAIAVRYFDSDGSIGAGSAALPENEAESPMVGAAAAAVELGTTGSPQSEPCYKLSRPYDRVGADDERKSERGSNSDSGGSSDLIGEDIDVLESSGESSGEDFATKPSRDRPRSAEGLTPSGIVSTAAAPIKGEGGSRQGSRLMMRRKISLTLHKRATDNPGGNRRHDSQPLLRMPALTNVDPAENEGVYMSRAYFSGIDIDPTSGQALESVTCSSAPDRRRRLHSIRDGDRSMSSRIAVQHGRAESAERVLSARWGPIQDVGDVFGQGHIKTVQRIRNTAVGNKNIPQCAQRLNNGIGLAGIKSRARRSSVAGTKSNRVELGPETDRLDSRSYAAAEADSAETADTADEVNTADISEYIKPRLQHGEQNEILHPPGAVIGVGNVDEESFTRGLDGKGRDGNDASAGGAADGGLPPELSILQEQSFGEMKPSYDFSDGGTLQMHGFVLGPDGMKSTPTLTPRLKERWTFDEDRSSRSRLSCEDGLRDFRPSSLQTCFGSDGRTPCSRGSNFGGGCERNANVSGGEWAGGERGSRGGQSGSRSKGMPPLAITTPRRTRETTILLEQIGRGGGGTVHRALHVPSLRLVAVKMVEVHDDCKRRQMIKELKALLSMNRVPLPLADDRSGSDGRRAPTNEWSFCSSESNGYCSWRDEDDTPTCEGGDVDWEDGLCGTDGSTMRKTTRKVVETGTATGTATVTPPSHLSTLSSRDSIPSFLKTQLSCDVGIGRARTVSEDQAGFNNTRWGVSACGSAPESTSISWNGVRSCRGSALLIANAGHPFRRNDNSANDSGYGSGGDGRKRGGTRRELPVVAFHDAYTDTERGRVCMVMEYMDGGTLEDFICRRKALSEPALAAVARSVLRGLTEMHANHQIHRDIKPSNILLDRRGRIKIADFGVVRELNKTGSLAQTFTGTMVYMSPERITESDYSYSSDVWSLGMVMAALALGRFPLNVTSRGSYFEIVKAITEDAVPALPPQIFSEELRGFVEHMLRRQASERPSTADLLAHPFMRKHQGCCNLVNMIKVAPASHAEVQSLLTKLVEYRVVEASEGEASSFFGKDTVTLSMALPRLRKAEVAFLAEQLQVTSAELVREYHKICTRAEEKLWGDTTQRSSRADRRFGRSDVVPQTPGVQPSRAPWFHSKSSPQPCVGYLVSRRNVCETPSTGGSAFSSSTPRRQWQESDTRTPFGSLNTTRLPSPRVRSASDGRRPASQQTTTRCLIQRQTFMPTDEYGE